MSQPLSLRGEYQYGRFGNKTFDFDRESRDIECATIVTGGMDTPTGRAASSTLDFHVMRVGINYCF